MAALPHFIATATKILRRDDDDGGDWDDDNDSNCVKATPGPNGYVSDLNACNAYYNYDPQFAPAVAVAVIFGLFLGVHIVQGFAYKKKYTWVVIMGAAWETLAFILHSLGTKDQQQIGYATGWNILFLLAPLWINAFVYMTFAREAYYFLPESDRRIRGINATSLAKWFVWADIVTFIIQAVGGSMASPGASANIIKTGLNVYLAGMSFQQFFIVVFLWLMIEFHIRCNSWGPGGAAEQGAGKRSWKPLHFALYGVLLCITIRIIYRISEFAGGITPSNPVPFHEEYSYVLDCFPMMLALLILAVWHPGRFLVGSASEFPKVSKSEKKQAKAERKAAKKSRKHSKGGKADIPGHITDEYEINDYGSDRRSNA
ncbi:RTA1 domain-containing protein [Seiridium cupressi]